MKAEQMLEKFVDEYSIVRGLDPEYVYSMHVGTERECRVRISDLREVLAQLTALQAERDALRAALKDMHGGWQYIRSSYGDLYGVGWDRCDANARAALGEPSNG